MFTKNKKLYEISLYPYRSLNKTDFFILMFALGLISFIAGIIFMLKGAWPVFGFFGRSMWPSVASMITADQLISSGLPYGPYLIEPTQPTIARANALMIKEG